jgi:hypothetical protein
MAQFGHSAPHITAEDEQREREHLTQAERQQIQIDLYGAGPIRSPNDTSVQEWSREQCSHAMQIAINNVPADKKVEYLDALERNHDTVMRESDPVAFMRAANFDAQVKFCQMRTMFSMFSQLQ